MSFVHFTSLIYYVSVSVPQTVPLKFCFSLWKRWNKSYSIYDAVSTRSSPHPRLPSTLMLQSCTWWTEHLSCQNAMFGTKPLNERVLTHRVFVMQRPCSSCLAGVGCGLRPPADDAPKNSAWVCKSLTRLSLLTLLLFLCEWRSWQLENSSA